MASEEMKAFTAEIDKLLNEKRPDRYTVSEKLIQSDGSDDDEQPQDTEQDRDGVGWMEEVIEMVVDIVPQDEVRQLYAERMVRSREGHKTQNGNRLIRKLADSGQHVLGWLECRRIPVAIVTRETLWGGNVRISDQRVALEALNKNDLERFEIHERRRASKDFSTRNDTCDAAQKIREMLIAVGAETVGEYFCEQERAEGSA